MLVTVRSISWLWHEIEASGQPVQDGAQTLKSHSIQKEGTPNTTICVLLTLNTEKYKDNLQNPENR